ncbi:WD40 repeat protein [Plasmopara halstedii]|uniref:WD40 repeat protein n=1 Tax=Plasmopara halstedii TaxID=4781 RepID=A0A0N7L4U7_PLAHL|nr:WD40 repeat protein [Plasmopara halstedii]CEG39667.1 WD40 repeat protein [Plasmopara halstedii]|eukprot:XP_024576036.1 WD40 repeat protein [Plasmopara halstedii]
MKTPTHSTRRNSTRISRRRGISNGTAAPLSPSRSSASSGPSAASECSLEVTACSLQRVNGLMLLLLCTRSNWLLYRLDNLSTTHESCSPIQMLMDPDKDTARVPNVRFIHLFGIPTEEIATQKLGALFVSERSAPLYLSDDEDEDFLPAAADVEDDNGCEDISILNLDEQKILFKLPPTPSLVLDVQTNATMAAVLCETRELFLYNLATFQLQQTIIVTSPAMALGSRWLAYPGYALSNDTTQAKGQEQSLVGKEDIDSDFDEVPIESLVLGGMATEARDMSHSSSPSYTAVDIAQNVASGLYYLSEVGRATIAPYLSSSPGRPKTDVQNGHIHTSAGSRHCIDHSQVADSKSYGLTSQQASQIDSSDKASIASKKHAGWVVMLDLVTKRILANFQCHSTALVNLSLDFSGLLLATSSTKGQNLHVYRLSPPLQSVITKPNGTLTCGLGTLHYQLAYKLQRGITHATIQDIAFSQDSKWINVTSAHGTSHLYAIHPEGARISADTHANTVESAALSDADDLGPGCLQRQVSDFYADFRALETRTQSQAQHQAK